MMFLEILFKIFGVIILIGSIYLGSSNDYLPNHIIGSLIHIPSLVLVFGGLTGLIFSSLPFLEVWKFLIQIFKESPGKIFKNISYFESLSEQMTESFYQGGVSQMTGLIDRNKLPYCWNILIPYLEAKIAFNDIKFLLQKNIGKIKEEATANNKMIELIISSSPALGMLGTIIGLIKLLQNLSDFSTLGSNMALALLTTLYGLLGALFMSPIAKHLERKSQGLLKSHLQGIQWIDHIGEKKPGFLLAQEDKK